MQLPHGAVIAVIDGQNIALWRNTGQDGAPDLAAQTAPQLDASNRSGVSHPSSPGNRDGHQGDEDAHAIAAVDWLNAETIAGRIKHLAVIAPPRTLGELRKHYHTQTTSALIGEVAKDMVHRSADEILALLAAAD